MVRWINLEKNIIIISRIEPWTWDEYREVGAEIVAMLNGVHHGVSIIDDYENSTFMPSTGFVDHAKWAAETYHRHPNVRSIVDVTGSLPSELFQSARDLYRVPDRSYSIARTRDQALKLITKHHHI